MISGGTMSGYWDVGKVSIATMPMMTVRIAMTIATIGRRMKNLDTVTSRRSGWRSGLQLRPKPRVG